MRPDHSVRLLVAILALAACDRTAGLVTHDLSGGFGDNGRSAVPPPTILSCVGFTAQSHLVPVSLIVMLDKSGSMGDGINGDPTMKWQAGDRGARLVLRRSSVAGRVGVAAVLPAERHVQLRCVLHAVGDPAPATRPRLRRGHGDADAERQHAHAAGRARRHQYAQDAQAMAPNERVAIVLVTDGDPDACNSSVTNVSLALGQVASQIPNLRHRRRRPASPA